MPSTCEKFFFFPKDVSDAGNEEEMYFLLADNNSEDEFSTIPFSAQKYKELTGFTLPSLYLLSRSKCSIDDGNSDTDTCLCEPVFEITPIDDEGNDVPSQSSTLLDSSEERRAFFQELEKQASESAAVDIAKEAERQAKENERRKRIADKIAKAETEVKALERLRKARELRVPLEPDSAHPRVVLSVRHLHLGVIKRAFIPTDTVSAVYDWVGSLSITPKHFALSKLPMVQIYQDESVTVASNELLTMIEVDDPIPLSRDDNEVSFYTEESESPPKEIFLRSRAVPVCGQ